MGVILDRHLTFGDDIDRITTKCHGLIGVLAKAASYLPTELLRLMYTALIRSHLEYASVVRASTSKTQLHKLDVIQKICSRIILHAPRDAHEAPLEAQLKLDSLSSRRETHIISLIDNMLSFNCHPTYRNMFRREPDGTVSTSTTARIGLGRRRLGIFGKEMYNKKAT